MHFNHPFNKHIRADRPLDHPVFPNEGAHAASASPGPFARRLPPCG